MSYIPKKILVPTDMSELATVALAYASDLGDRAGAELDVLYADSFLPPPYFTSVQVDEVAAAIVASKQVAWTELRAYTRRHASNAGVHVVEDVPVTAIVAWAQENDPDLIVMGTHGRSGMNRVMLGSVTERVIRETSTPVLVVRGPGRQSEGFCHIRRVLCPVNFTAVSQLAAEYAMEYAALLGAELTMLYVADRGDVRAQEDLQHIERWIPASKLPVTNVARMVVHGDPAAQVIQYARATGSQLIVLGAQHKRFADTTVIGTTTARVTRHASCPVLTVTRPADAGEAAA